MPITCGRERDSWLISVERYQKFGSYYEPFLGGGALLFNLLSENKNLKGHVSDLNSDLVLSYPYGI